MSDKVKPALAAEEWALIERGDYARLPDSVWDDLARSTPETCLGAAAVALHFAGPDGTALFTWEDVAALRKQAEALERSYALAAAFVPPNEHRASTPGVSAIADLFRSIADRLAALLPPRETEKPEP